MPVRLPDLARRHQLCDPLAEGACRQAGLRADAVGLSGQSSGGHLAMLSAMRPNDKRYAAIASPGGAAVDATVKAVVMQWPVINPLSRYRNAVRLKDLGNPPAWVGDIPSRHDLYWKTEAAMEEGNPLLILERGEKVALPPTLWIQGRPDPTHDYRDPVGTFDGNEPERFAHNYRRGRRRAGIALHRQCHPRHGDVARPDRGVLPAPSGLKPLARRSRRGPPSARDAAAHLRRPPRNRTFKRTKISFHGIKGRSLASRRLRLFGIDREVRLSTRT